MRADDPIDVGVIGVGSMGRHHARVYRELGDTRLVGVSDVDAERGREVADSYATEYLPRHDLLEAVDAVSVVVPTAYHVEVTTACLEAGVAPLVEKPIAPSPADGSRLAALAETVGVPIQVGHIERFNPVITTLAEFIDDLDVLSVRAERLGPPPERDIADSAVFDLMTHDLDIICSLLDAQPTDVMSAGIRDNTFATAVLRFPCGRIASLTASRLTQRKVRRLAITAESCYIEVDYLDQSIEIHRNSVPEYITDDGGVRFTHESVIERPSVPRTEPLKAELASFIETVRTGGEPAVTIEEGIRAVELAREIEAGADTVEVIQPLQVSDDD